MASSGTPEKIATASLRGSLRPTRAEYFFRTQVKFGKPAPDLFLFAAEQMNVPPARCLVIEDSVPGVAGGAPPG